MLYVNYITAKQRGKNLPPLKYALVVLFIAELIIFSPNLLLLLPAQFLLKPPLSSHAAKPEASKLPDLLLSRSISWEVASFASNPPLHVLCHSSNSHYLNSRGWFSKSDKSSSSLQSPIQVVNYPCINLHKTQLHSCSPHPLKNLQQLLTAYLIKCESRLATSTTCHQQTETYVPLTISQDRLFNHLLTYRVYF